MNLEKLYDILLSDNPSKNIKIHEKDLFNFIPDLKKCKGFEQNNKWHIYDVYEHILYVVDGVDKNLTLRLAALFHDIGKPLSYTEDEKGIGHFYNHWNISRDIFLKFAKGNKLDKELVNDVSTLIFYHDMNLDKSDDELIGIINDIGYHNISLLYNLKRADLLAQSKEFHYLIDNYNKEEEKINKLINKHNTL